MTSLCAEQVEVLVTISSKIHFLEEIKFNASFITSNILLRCELEVVKSIPEYLAAFTESLAEVSYNNDVFNFLEAFNDQFNEIKIFACICRKTRR